MTFLSTLSTLLSTATTGGNIGGGFWMPPGASTIAGEIDWIFFFIYWMRSMYEIFVTTYFVISIKVIALFTAKFTIPKYKNMMI